jgi:hypothetical protein
MGKKIGTGVDRFKRESGLIEVSIGGVSDLH